MAYFLKTVFTQVIYRFNCIFNIETISFQINNFKMAGFFKKQDSLHARLSSHYETGSYKKKKYKKIKTYKKFVQKEHTDKRYILIPDLYNYLDYRSKEGILWPENSRAQVCTEMPIIKIFELLKYALLHFLLKLLLHIF